MTINDYETITGLTVSASNTALVTAQIEKSRRILETMLGYTLILDDAHDNQYTESGKTVFECPCPSTDNTLTLPDAVITAYRLYPYNLNDKYLLIDPATAINAVKLVFGNVTYKTLDEDEYRPHTEFGMIKALEQIKCFYTCQSQCDHVQLAVDADWLWFTADTIPSDLLDVWAEMTTYYSDQKKNIQAETLGSHSYKKFNDIKPEEEKSNIAIIQKYAGPLGSIKRTITL